MQYMFENKGKWIKQFNESLQRRNEVRYINPDNLDKYDKDEIEEVTTASGEKRYKRKDTTSVAQSVKQQNTPAQKLDAELNKAYPEPENETDKYSGHNSIGASVPVARQTLMDLADKFNGTYNKSKKRVEFKKNSDMQKAIKALRELPAGRFSYVFSSNYFGDGYQVKPKDYNVESIQKNEDNRDLAKVIAATLNNIKGLQTANAYVDKELDAYTVIIPIISGSCFTDVRQKAVQRLKTSKFHGTSEVKNGCLYVHIDRR